MRTWMLSFLLITAIFQNPYLTGGEKKPEDANTKCQLTEKEAVEFAKSLEKAFKDKNQADIQRAFHYHKLTERVLANLDIDQEIKKEILQSSDECGALFVKSLLEATKNAEYRYVKTRKIDGCFRVLFRITNEEMGVTYHEYLVAKSLDGTVGIEDLYGTNTGEMMSTTIRRTTVLVIVNKNDRVTLTDSEKLFLKHYADVRKASAHLRGGKFKEALAIYQSLPTEVRAMKQVGIAAIAAAAQCDDDSFPSLYDEFNANHPGDAATGIWSIHYYYLKEDWDKCIASINRLDKNIGGDPYLCVRKAECYFNAQKYEKAAEELEIAVKDDFSLKQSYNLLILTNLKLKNAKGVLRWLKSMKEHTPLIDPETMKSNPSYSDFLTTPEFQEYRDWYQQNKK